MDLKVNYTLRQNGAKKRFELATNHLSTYHYRGVEYDVGCLTKEKLLVLIDELNQENMELEKRVTDLECEIKEIKTILDDYKYYFESMGVI